MTRIGGFLAWTLLLLALATVSATADWPQWRGPARDGHSTDTGLLQLWPKGGPPLAWSAKGLGANLSSVAVAGGRIYAIGSGESQYLLALRESDGQQVWRQTIAPSADAGDASGPRGTPTVDGTRVYAVASDGTVVCLDAASGKERWRKSLESEFGGRQRANAGYADSPLVDEGRVIVAPGTAAAGLVALDKLTGKEIWRAALPSVMESNGQEGALTSSTVVSNASGIKQYVQMIGGGLVGVRATDGQVLWHYNRIASRAARGSTPIVRGDHVFASTEGGSTLIQLVRNGDGLVVREVYFLGPDQDIGQSQLVLVGEFLYGGSTERSALCLNWRTGKLMWGAGSAGSGEGAASVTYADGRLYYRYESGKVSLVEATPEAYQEYGSLEVPAMSPASWSTPVISGGHLYLRQHDNLYRYTIRRPSSRK